MGVIGILGGLAMVLFFPGNKNAVSRAAPVQSYKKILQILLKDQPSLDAIAYVFFFSAAIDNLFAICGAWLEKAFDIGIVVLDLGRIVGALIEGPIWLSGGIVATGLISADLTALSLLSLTWGLRGWDKS